jgi:transposase InsO family protein
MAYTNNPKAPKVRRDAVLFSNKHGVRVAARHYGVSPGTISKWRKRATKIGLHPIPSYSSAPKHHPNQLSNELVWKIYHKRLLRNRCAEVVHRELLNDGVVVSLASVKRTLDRLHLTKKRSPWKRYHPHVDRPYPLKPGDLVQIDTIHTMQSEKVRMYTFVLIDVHSRWVYAKSYQKMNSARTVRFVREAQRCAPFVFSMLQSDHGPEFGKWFVSQIKKSHRYTRIGKPNDNAHIERMNRTLQEECLDKELRTPRAYNRALKQYLPYYNGERLHLGIALQTPSQLFTGCFQGAD